MRGQYAYPQRILAPRALVREVQIVSVRYGIPTLVLDPIESDTLCTDPGCSCGVMCRVTGMRRDTPSVLIPPPTITIKGDAAGARTMITNALTNALTRKHKS
jgi:hypothetical protein